MQVQSDDVTVPWGRAPDPLDQQNGHWRLAVYQDVQESLDASKLYFLYDPIADEHSGTSGPRKGLASLVVFDMHRRCFVRDISLRVQGRVKFLFGLKCPSPSGGSSYVLCTQSEDYGQVSLLIWRLNVTADGMNVEGDPRPLTNSPIPVANDWIVSLREDAPELIVLTGPGLTVWRVNAMAEQPQPPSESFSVPGAHLSHYYDGFLSRGNVYLMSASPDGHLDWSRVHVLSLTGDQRSINTAMCQGDPARGMPPPRKQAALDSIAGYILLAGGEIDYGGGNVQRLVDYWILDLTSFRWQQLPASMPLPLIEPRLTTTAMGNVYLWGDFDQPLPGMPPSGTHLRILKVNGMGGQQPSSDQPPPYAQAVSYPTQQQGYGMPQPAYLSQGAYSQPQPYGAPSPPQQQGYGYGSPQPTGFAYGQAPTGPPSGQQAYYPPQQKKNECAIC